MLRLALPLVMAEVGWMSMGVVDTVMVGHLPHPAVTISAVALGQVLYNTLAFGIGGVLLGLDTYISQAHGAGELDDANKWLLSGVVLAGLLSAALMGMVWMGPLAMTRMPIDREVMGQAIAFLWALNWGTLPLFLYMTFRRYLQAFNHVRPIAAAVVSANLVNAGLDWLFLFGHRFHVGSWSVGIPAWGVVGAAWSTTLARVYLAMFVGLAVWWVDRRHGYGLRSAQRALDWARVSRLVRLGAPVGAQIFVEISIFAAVTALIGVMGTVPLAGHEIALNCVAFTFMVPFAISAAASVRVGQAVGRGSAGEARAAGWTAIGFGSGFMLCMSALLLAVPGAIARGFTHDPAVIAAAVPLLLVGAAFQFFDGVQITATGALRGAGNTHAGLYVQMIGYWVIGLPIGWWLGFGRKMGAVGLWIGLAAGLMFAGVALITVWARTVKRGVGRV
ncbi:MAG: MATE family efflux transporter [Acidobacteriota bacterium]|nr:MATE family efflux transporter [Acidobacteriota bacterium]